LNLEYRIVLKSGEERWVHDRCFPLRDASGHIYRLVGVASDITSRKRAEEALGEADRRKDEFIATLSHELRNPLAPLVNSLQLLRLASREEGASAQVRETMERQVTHLVRLVDDLLELSRISRGTLELRAERVEVATIVRNACETVQPLIEAARHQLHVALPDEPLWVDGDPVRLAQILTNLLNNAARYSDPNGEVSIDVVRQEQHVLISVRDKGIGIEPQEISRMFDMFNRGERRGYGQGGLGVGLALARRLTHMHGGTVEGFSEGHAKGSTFTLRLPLAEKPVPDAAPAKREAGSPASKRILVVDDNRDAASSLAMMLECIGHEARAAYDGHEALAAAEAFNPEVVLLDIGMPNISGFEVCRRLRAQPYGRMMTIVALTGWGQDSDKRKTHEAGFDHHLVKPADAEALRKLLSSLRDQGSRKETA
jgi:signal transduction histidine kinase/CheY-like chemotaxis protein